jgi:two-component system chemotaxis response regulator CheY
MSKKVLLVGHCGPDSSYLKSAVKSAERSVSIVMADDQQELRTALDAGEIDLVLFNRELGYGFDEKYGVDVIKYLSGNYPTMKMMLVSNYADAQSAAVAAGAIPGFGKREIGSPRVLALLKDALATAGA